MKRGAEKQLSKDDHSDDEAQDDASQVGFQKADQSVLATRQICALPKRGSVAALPLAQTSSSNFSGYNGGSSLLSGFTTGVPTAEAAPTPVQTNTAKSLSSLLSSNSAEKSINSTSAFGSSSPFPASSTTSLTASSTPASTKKDAEADYFKNLRGLNESLRSAVNEFVDVDPSADLSEVFDQYRDYRAKIQEGFDTKVSPSSTTTPAPSVPVANKLPTQAPPSGGLSSDEVKALTSTDIKPLATSSSGSAFDIQSKANKSDGSSSSLPFSPVSDPVDTTHSGPASTTSVFSGFGTKQNETFSPASTTSAFSGFVSKQHETSKGPIPASQTSTLSVFGTKQNETSKGFSSASVFGTKQHETSKDSTSASQTSALSGFGTKQHETPKGFSPVSTTSAFSSFGTKQHEISKGPIPASQTSTLSVFGTRQNETSKGFSSASVFGTKQHETSKDSTSASQTSALSGFGTRQHETSNPTPNLLSQQTDSKTSPPASLALTGSTKPETKPTSLSSPRAFGSGFSSSFNVTALTQPDGSSVSSKFTNFTGFGSLSKPATTPVSLGFQPSFMTPMTSFSSDFAKTPSTLTATASDLNAHGDVAETAATTQPFDANAKTLGSAFLTTTAESFILDTDNKHDQEGAGEEDEETVYSTKLKAYVLKDGEAGKSWVELGYGVLRVKKHNKSQAKRILLRSSSTGQILINFNLYTAFKPMLKGKNVTFLGHDAESVSKMYTVKLQTQEQAAELAATLNREIQGRNAS